MKYLWKDAVKIIAIQPALLKAMKIVTLQLPYEKAMKIQWKSKDHSQRDLK